MPEVFNIMKPDQRNEFRRIHKTFFISDWIHFVFTTRYQGDMEIFKHRKIPEKAYACM